MTVITLPYPQLCFNNNKITPSIGFRKKPRNVSFVTPNSNITIEKEHEFKPSFDEYLKAMETVKIRREKRLTPPGEKIDGEKDELSGNKKWVRKNLEFKDGIEVGIKKDVEFQEPGFDMKRGLSNSKEGEVMKKWTRKKSDFENAQMDSEFQEQDEVMKKWTRKKTDINGFQEQRFKGSNVKKPSAKNEYNNHDNMEIERAAFKSFEESEDVCDQPRVSRVDMEERIQRLAKCLNGASIDTPEWNFSKMMRSAKIRFADFSIIRLIQILGNYLNWRRVLQVIEWMQARERFKSNRIRNVYTAALDALGKARRPVEALNVFHTMQVFHVHVLSIRRICHDSRA